MNSSDLFGIYCKFIDERFFSEDNIGSSVAFVVDHALINDFCRQNNIVECDLTRAVRRNLFSRNISHTHIKGDLAIQLYAASKRSDSKGITVKNYRDRLSQVLLGWDMEVLQLWMERYQEDYWEKFYSWCDSLFFFVTKYQLR